LARFAAQHLNQGNFSSVKAFYGDTESRASATHLQKGTIMLNLVVTLLIIALIAAVLGFGGIASTAVSIAQVVFLVALVLFVVAAIAGTIRTV
jgi:uncharacterized membrane protein YtjA (UPF0391 family)